MEYPSYGIFLGESPSCDTIIQNAEIVFDFLINQMGYHHSDIIIMGRSIGSGPACHIASKY